MRFYFDIEDSEFDDEFGLNFCETVKTVLVSHLQR